MMSIFLVTFIVRPSVSLDHSDADSVVHDVRLAPFALFCFVLAARC